VSRVTSCQVSQHFEIPPVGKKQASEITLQKARPENENDDGIRVVIWWRPQEAL